MDIDEFLDKELQIEKKEGIEEKPAFIEVTKEEEGTIKHYFGLWDEVSKAKFRWDSNLHTELSETGIKVKQELNKLLSTIQREKDTIRHLVGKATHELENKNYESATRLYSEVTDMRDSFPDFFLEKKRGLNKEISQLHERLQDHIDSKFIEDSTRSIAKVDNLIRDSFHNLKQGKIEPAKTIYENALKAYKALPNGFLSQKIELGNGLLALYKDLSIYTQITDLQQHLAKKSPQSYSLISKVDNLRRLSEIVKNRVKPMEKTFVFPTTKIIPNEERHQFPNLNISPERRKYPMPNETLLPRLIARKLDRAKINLKKELYLEAKKNLESVLKVDPENTEAKQMLNNLSV